MTIPIPRGGALAWVCLAVLSAAVNAAPTVLLDFETADETRAVPEISTTALRVGITNEFATSGSHAAFFSCPHWKPGMPEWPAFDIKPLAITDWREFDRLVIDLVNLGEEGNTLYLYYSGNRGGAVKLPGNGFKRWIVPLKNWPTKDAKEHVEKLHFFSYIPTAFTVMIDRITLLRPGEEPPTDCNASIWEGLGGRISEAVADSRMSLAAMAHEVDCARFASACREAGQTSRELFLGTFSSMEAARPRGRFSARPVAADGLGVRLARNEREGVQLLVMPVAGDLENVRVTAEGFEGFAASAIACEVVGYVNTTNLPPYMVGHTVPTNNAAGYLRVTERPELGWWPNPILGFLDGVAVKGGDVQSFWIRVNCPEDQPPGTYRGSLVVSARGAAPLRVPFSIRVNDFTLPRTSMLPLAVTFFAETHGQDVASGKAIRADPDAPFNAWRRHAPEWVSFFADYLLSYDSIYQKSCMSRTNELMRLWREGRLGRFNLGYWGPPGKDEGVESWASRTIPTLAAAYEWAASAGILDHAYLYGCDEVNADRFEDLRGCAAELKRALPGVPLLTTARDRSYGLSSPLSEIDGFCPLLETYRVGEAEKARKAGHQVWWYICNYPFAPYPNMYIECQPIEGRLLMGAQSVRMKPDGFLYYQTGIWESPRCIESGPFTDWNPRSFRSYHGDGAWTCVGPDGIPVPTIRLENFRDGLEDYAYAKLLEKKLQEVEGACTPPSPAGSGKCARNAASSWLRRAKAALAVPREVMDSMTNYTDDPAVLYRWRDEMADLLEEKAPHAP